MSQKDPRPPSYEELVAMLKRAEEERHELVAQLRDMQREQDLAAGGSAERAVASHGGPGERTRRPTLGYGRDGEKRPERTPGFHIEGRVRRQSDVIAVAPSWIPGSPRPGIVDTRKVEERADFDAGRLRQLDAPQLDSLPYGVVVVDGEGRVVEYNDTEARMVGLERSQVIGKNFFLDIAPCTRIQQFLGRFETFVANDHGFGVETFDFVFRFRHSTQSVTVYITAGRRRGTYNIAMLRRNVAYHE